MQTKVAVMGGTGAEGYKAAAVAGTGEAAGHMKTDATAPEPGVGQAIASAEAIIACPSDTFSSIGPILAVPGIREALRQKRERVAAIVAGRALKGPAAAMMKSMKRRPAAAEVGRLYRDFAGVFVLDEMDRKQSAEVESLGMRPLVTNTIMHGLREREALARLMYEHTLAELCQASGIDRVAVITNDPAIAEHARGLNVLVFEETEQRSHSASADDACLRAIELGAIGTGTNALARTPPGIIAGRFGPFSFEAPSELARAQGVPAEVLRLAGLMFDIDTPDDVAELLERAPESYVTSFLRLACASK